MATLTSLIWKCRLRLVFGRWRLAGRPEPQKGGRDAAAKVASIWVRLEMTNKEDGRKEEWTERGRGKFATAGMAELEGSSMGSGPDLSASFILGIIDYDSGYCL